MIGALCSFYDEHKAAFTEDTGVADQFSDVKAIYKEIGLNIRVTSEGTKNKVVSKDVSREAMIKATLVTAGSIYSYAVDKNNIELLKFSDINSSKFNRLRDSEVPLYCETIVNKADELGSELDNYSSSVEKRNAVRAMIDDYMNKFSSVNTGKGSKKTANQTIILLMNKADKKIKGLDNLMLQYEKTNNELYLEYKAARVIYDKGGSRGDNGNDDSTPPPDEPNP